MHTITPSFTFISAEDTKVHTGYPVSTWNELRLQLEKVIEAYGTTDIIIYDNKQIIATYIDSWFKTGDCFILDTTNNDCPQELKENLSTLIDCLNQAISNPKYYPLIDAKELSEKANFPAGWPKIQCIELIRLLTTLREQ